jgi:multidrug resistance protein, MATE family
LGIGNKKRGENDAKIDVFLDVSPRLHCESHSITIQLVRRILLFQFFRVARKRHKAKTTGVRGHNPWVLTGTVLSVPSTRKVRVASDERPGSFRRFGFRRSLERNQACSVLTCSSSTQVSVNLHRIFSTTTKQGCRLSMGQQASTASAAEDDDSTRPNELDLEGVSATAVTQIESDPLLPSDHAEEYEDDTNQPNNDKGTEVKEIEDGSVYSDAKDTILLGFPIFLAMLSWVGMKTTDSALLGHVSSQALSAASLSDLWTMCSGVFLQARVLGVLVGTSVGAGNPKMAGVWMQVSLVVLSGMVGLVFACWWLTEAFWIAFGEKDREVTHMAGQYARILAFSLPGQLGFSQLSQFFSAQRIMHPEVFAASIALLLNLALGLVFVLGIPIPHFDGYGFAACPIVTTLVVYVQLFVLWYVFVHLQRLHEPCWGGWIRKEITGPRIKAFCDLYFPSALSISSDFWRVAVIGAVAAKLGTVEVAVFNTSYRIMWIVLIMVNSLASAAGIKMSMRLGNMDHRGAKQAGHVGIGMSAVVLALIGLLVVWKIRWLGQIFTGDDEFLNLFAEAKWPFTVTLVLMNLSVAIERIPFSMGRTQEVFWYGFVASWAGQVPAVLLFTTYWRADLVGLYWGMAVGYLVLAGLYSWIAFTRCVRPWIVYN